MWSPSMKRIMKKSKFRTLKKTQSQVLAWPWAKFAHEAAVDDYPLNADGECDSILYDGTSLPNWISALPHQETTVGGYLPKYDSTFQEIYSFTQLNLAIVPDETTDLGYLHKYDR